MSEGGPRFKRILLGLPHSRLDYAGVRAAADLAALMRLALFGAFVEDRSLAALGELPCVRELHPLGGGWQPIEPARLSREREDAIETARRLFAEAVRMRPIESEFSVVRGSAADLIGATARADDIVGIIQPHHPADRITAQFDRLLDAAFGAKSAVMLVPGRAAWRRGSVAALATGADDPSIEAALSIAALANERLVVLRTTGHPIGSPLLDRAAATGVRMVQIEAGSTAAGTAVATALAGSRPSLVVATRGRIDDAVLRSIAPVRHCPVLVIEPDPSRASKEDRSPPQARAAPSRA